MTITIYVVNCDTDPGPLTPADVESGNVPAEAGCVLPSGVRFSVTQNGVPLGTPGVAFPFVSADGRFTVTVLVGSTVVVTEDTTSTGGTGSVAVFQATADLFVPVVNPITIANVAATEDGVVFRNVLQPGSSPSPQPSPGANPSPDPSTPPDAGSSPNPNPGPDPSAPPSSTLTNTPSPAPDPITRFPGTGVGPIDAAGGIPMLIVVALAGAAVAGFLGTRRRKARGA